MEQENRRDFLKQGVQLCAICVLTGCLGRGIAQENTEAQKEEAPNPVNMTYCGYKCTNDCPLYKATIEDNVELKKKVYEDWKMKENRGFDFDPALVFCWGCKVEDKPKNSGLEKCTVRKCAVEKKLDSCIQCKGLKECDKKLWTDYPDFKKAIVQLQEKYVRLSGKELI